MPTKKKTTTEPVDMVDEITRVLALTLEAGICDAARAMQELPEGCLRPVRFEDVEVTTDAVVDRLMVDDTIRQAIYRSVHMVIRRSIG